MTTMELEAYRAELARQILTTESRELLDAVCRTIKRIAKSHSGTSVSKEDLTPYSMQEIKEWIHESMEDIASNNVYTLEEIEAEDLNEMPWLTK